MCLAVKKPHLHLIIVSKKKYISSGHHTVQCFSLGSPVSFYFVPGIEATEVKKMNFETLPL